MSRIPDISLLWILILSNITANVLSQDLCPSTQPESCKCENVQQDDGSYYKLVNCSGLGLSFVPDNLPMDAQKIEFSGNKLINIDAFKSFPDLRYLSLANNGIEYIPFMGFSNLQYLKELDFTGNILQSITEETFYGLRELQVFKGLETKHVLANAFDVFDRLETLSVTIASETMPEHIFETLLVHTLEMKITKARSLPDSIFNFGKNTLTELTIEGKSLISLPANLLSGLRLLKVFILKVHDLHTLPHNLFYDVDEMNDCDVAFCKPINLREIEIHGVKTLPRDIFKGQKSIERITIRGIEDLPTGIFNNLVTLDDLDLSESRLTNISYNLFSSMSSLKTLTLRSCNLMLVTDNDFQGLTSLKNLDISNNSIQILANCSFEPFRYNLQRLNLSGNNLTSLDRHALKDMHYLNFLDVANNKLKNLNDDVFYDLIRLQSLSMRNNFLTSLPVSIFRSQRKLQEVDLSGNSLEPLPKDLFKGTVSLKRIDLSNNIITTLPNGIIAYMYRLDLNIANNPINCECKLRSLIVGWIAASKLLNIHGHCETPRYLYQTSLHSLTYDETCSDTDYAIAVSATVPSQSMEIFPNTLMPSSATNIFASSDYFAQMTGIYPLMSTVEGPQMITPTDVFKTSYSFSEGKEMMQTASVATILNSKLHLVPSSMDEKPYDADVLEIHAKIVASSTIVAESLSSSFSVTYPVSTFPKDESENLSRTTFEPTPAYSGSSRSQDDLSSTLIPGTNASMDVIMTVNATAIGTNVMTEETPTKTTSIISNNQTIIDINETIFPNQSFLNLSVEADKEATPVEDTPSFYVAIAIVVISLSISLSVAAFIVWKKRCSRRRIYEVTPVSSKENESCKRTISKNSPVTTVSLTQIDNVHS